MNPRLEDPEWLTERLAPLFAGASRPAAELGLSAVELASLGFEVHEGLARIPPQVERLDRELIVALLSGRARDWLRQLDTHEVVGSTSTMLNDLVGSQPIDGLIKMAELQVQGRGRRGRGWLSPYGNNLAISLGARLPQRPDQLGGFSLCMGLAVADRLRGASEAPVELKWPNDVLVDGRKIAGVLIELHSGGSAAGTEVTVGIGVNYRLPAAALAAIDQPATDLLAVNPAETRNRLAAGIISSVVDYLDGFASAGFSPMRAAFNELHRFHERECRLLLGAESVAGIVRGVTERGELMLDTGSAIRSFGAGEVSLRGIDT